MDEPFTDSERRRLLRLAIESVPVSQPPDEELLAIIAKLSGTDTMLYARRAYPPHV